jgi:hypothetical protein
MRLLPVLVLALLLGGCTISGPYDVRENATGPAHTLSAERNELDGKRGFSIGYPTGWEKREDITMMTPEGAFPGTAFLPPVEIALGTDLLDAYVHAHAGAAPCPVGPDDHELKIGGRTFRQNFWSDGAAGSLYQGTVYRTEDDDTCYTLTLYTHSCNLGAGCGPDMDKPFDRSQLVMAFEKMIESFEVR